MSSDLKHYEYGDAVDCILCPQDSDTVCLPDLDHHLLCTSDDSHPYPLFLDWAAVEEEFSTNGKDVYYSLDYTFSQY